LLQGWRGYNFLFLLLEEYGEELAGGFLFFGRSGGHIAIAIAATLAAIAMIMTSGGRA